MLYNVDMYYRRNADETIRTLQKALHQGDTSVIPHLTAEYVRTGSLPISLLVNYPREMFNSLPEDLQRINEPKPYVDA